MSRRRAISSTSGGGRLPSEYQEVEYIQLDTSEPKTTGLLLNIAWNSIRKINLTYSLDSSRNGKRGNIILSSYMNGFVSVPPFITTENYSGSFDITINPAFLDKSEIILKQTFLISCNVTSTNEIKVGAWLDSNWSLDGKYWLIEFYDNSNNLVCNLIPCYRKSDNEPGMYDLVNDVFYTNSGTGSFVVGADVNLENTEV